MSVDFYDDVKLKDGREGCVIEIYEHPQGNGYEIELSDSPYNSDTIVVKIDEIKEVIRKSR